MPITYRTPRYWEYTVVSLTNHRQIAEELLRRLSEYTVDTASSARLLDELLSVVDAEGFCPDAVMAISNVPSLTNEVRALAASVARRLDVPCLAYPPRPADGDASAPDAANIYSLLAILPAEEGLTQLGPHEARPVLARAFPKADLVFLCLAPRATREIFSATSPVVPATSQTAQTAALHPPRPIEPAAPPQAPAPTFHSPSAKPPKRPSAPKKELSEIIHTPAQSQAPAPAAAPPTPKTTHEISFPAHRSPGNLPLIDRSASSSSSSSTQPARPRSPTDLPPIDRPRYKELYHFTHPSNLPSIQQHGLLSWNQLIEKGIPHIPASTTLSRNLDARRGLEDWVRLYLAYNHPMIEAAIRENRVEELVRIYVSSQIFLDTRLEFLFSNTNATANSAIINKDWRTAYHSSDVQAEVLVRKWIPPKYIRIP
ncbi:MAG: hypothetical protein KatS3mg063_0383 [Tepidiforma sp.]|nr:MAG: hypothetical protein KatS3mg063_0383 [Tepidiforma sp.]